MYRITAATAALLATTAIAQAGGLDRSGLGISPIFEDGTYVELSFGSVRPSVSGTVGGGALSSGDMAESYLNYSFAVRDDLSDRLSYAIIYEQAYGAHISYANAAPGYPLGFITDAELTGTALSAILRYELNDRFSIHGGVRYVTMSGEITLNGGANNFDYEASSDVGYLVGVAYEIPDIALRASLTYNSATTHNNATTVNGAPIAPTGEYTMPQSVNLDFQTGIAEGTLLLASVRWAEWTETAINTNAIGIIDYSNDVFTYSLGVARRLSDDFAILGRVTYETSQGGLASNLAPTDGSLGLSIAGIYDVGNARITAGVNYTMLGDATTELINAQFQDNSAWGFGVRVGFSF